jgi:hypothetical protein
VRKLFSLNEFNAKAEQIKEDQTDKSSMYAAKFVEKHNIKVDNLKSLTGRFPDSGEAFFLWTLNSFNAFTFIVYIIKQCGKIDDLTLSTYSINDRILTSLVKWYDKGFIENVNISISDSIRQRNPRVYDQLESQKQNRNININYSWNHSKVTLMKTPEHRFVVEGSGNFSENAAHEQYIFTNDPSLYDFRYKCIMT